MNLRQLDQFLAVARYGSFTAASAHLGVAQPSLTKSIRAIERELGVKLFERLPRGVVLTAPGCALQRHAERVGVQMLDETLKHHQWTQEVRLNGSIGKPIDYTIGGFYLEQGGTLQARVDLPFVPGLADEPTFVNQLICGQDLCQGPLDFLHGPDLTTAHTYAAFAHAMDFDDTHQQAVMHPSVTIFPTLLALAEDRKASGADFIAAAVVGYDGVNKLGCAHGPAVPYTWGVLAMLFAPRRWIRMLATLTTITTFAVPYVYFWMHGRDYPPFVVAVIAALTIASISIEVVKYLQERALRGRYRSARVAATVRMIPVRITQAPETSQTTAIQGFPVG